MHNQNSNSYAKILKTDLFLVSSDLKLVETNKMKNKLSDFFKVNKKLITLFCLSKR